MSATEPLPVVLSPHFDDAVVSCWHVLSGGPKGMVVNFFTGIPGPGPLTMADKLARMPSSAELLRVRREEDRAALATVGWPSICLDFIEDQYRDSVDPDELERAFHARAPAASRVYAPAAIGAHPDHELVRDLALRLADQGAQVELYADIPYSVRYGWPSWVTGIDTGPHLDVDAYWDEFLPKITDRGYRLKVERHDLGEEGSDAKLEAMQLYATQFQQLNSGIVDRLRNPVIRRYEVSWAVG